ncbi:MAG: OmpA family protein [Rhizobacter sp.]
MKTKLKYEYGLALAAMAAVFGCAQNRAPEVVMHKTEGVAITQVGYGPNAKYVTCPLAGCARPSPKTMVEPPSAEEPPMRVSAAQPLAEPPAPVEAVPVPAIQPAALPVEVKKEEQPSTELPVDFMPPPRAYVNFPVRSARLTEEAKRRLDELVPFVKSANRVVIKGRTDESGDSDSNDRLALRRAMAVYDHLRRAANAGDKPFKLLAKGACCYIARNDTEVGRAENRRAEIDFVLPMQASVSSPRRASGKAHSS